MNKYAQLSHPLLTEKGISQKERSPLLLNPHSIKVDDVSFEDSLDFVNKFSRYVNFYNASSQDDVDFDISNWKSFFDKDAIFKMAKFVKTDVDILENNLERITNLLNENQNNDNVELLLNFVLNELILFFELSYAETLKISSRISDTIQRQMSSTLRAPLVEFVKIYKRLVDLNVINPNFNLKSKIDFKYWFLVYNDIETPTSGLKDELVDRLNRNAEVLINEVRILIRTSDDFLPQLLYPTSEDEKSKITPHIGLLITFLRLKEKLKSGINELPKKHLLHFYKDVLKIKGRVARPDESFVVFQLQKHIETSYLVKKGTEVKDGKDNNKADIIFALDKNIVLDKAEVKSLKTLFINQVCGVENNIILNDDGSTLLAVIDHGRSCNQENELDYFDEGLYIAPTANNWDGVDEAFKDDPKIWPSLGSKYSKFNLGNEPVEHPPAKLGFVLSSPVLLLNEGKRKIKIDLTLSFNVNTHIQKFDNNVFFNSYYNTSLDSLLALEALLTEDDFGILIDLICINLNVVLDAKFDDLVCEGRISLADINFLRSKRINGSFKFVELIKYYSSKEISYSFVEFIFNNFSCRKRLSGIADDTFTKEVLDVINLYLKVDLFSICVTGEDEWLDVSSSDIEIIKFEKVGATNKLYIEIDLNDDFPALTFPNIDSVEKEIGVSNPAIKFVVNPYFKINVNSRGYDPCCTLLHCKPSEILEVSAYHYLKDVIVEDSCINVEVCGVKNLIVQNDESVQDVNGLIYPFGTRPNIPDFNRDFFHDFEAPNNQNMEGPSFYIGSCEILHKSWERININLNWNEKPSDFKELYLAYRFKNIEGTPAIEKGTNDIYGLDEGDFEINVSLLKEKVWIREVDINPDKEINKFTGHLNRKLFAEDWDKTGLICEDYYETLLEKPFDQVIKFKHEDFKNDDLGFSDITLEPKPLDIDTRNGFLRLTLENQDFMHKEYAFILARQMMALGNITNGDALEGAAYIDSGTGSIIPFNSISILLFNLNFAIDQACSGATISSAKGLALRNALANLQTELTQLDTELNNPAATNATISSAFDDVELLLNDLMDNSPNSAQNLSSNIAALKVIACDMKDDKDELGFLSSYFNLGGGLKKPLEVPIPNEPWTPIIKDISIDYTAKATANDIELVHLHAFDKTYKVESLNTNPFLLPQYRNEGNLFIGLDNLTRGNTLNLLIHLAEATADTESDKANIEWSYLLNNSWKKLENNFDVVEDGTSDFSRSGIVEIVVPQDIKNVGHTIMPDELYWLRASAADNSKATCEAFNLYTQAAKVTASLKENNDLQRLSDSLENDKLKKLVKADTSIKKIVQPIPSFNGRPPEAIDNKALFKRISERLRHKGRAVTAYDYERILLDEFDLVFNAKTINHSFGLDASKYFRDIEVVAPGFINIAVIPDIEKIASGNTLEPRMPVSQLENMVRYLKSRSTPFARLKVMNPRYEKVNIALRVAFKAEYTGPFYIKDLENKLQSFLAPWILGKSDRLCFGSSLSKSEIVNFIEQQYFVDYICHLDWAHELEKTDRCLPVSVLCCEKRADIPDIITPLTSRSILTAGHIHVCELEHVCPSYDLRSKSCFDKPVIRPTDPEIVIL